MTEQADIERDREALREALNEIEDRVNPTKLVERARIAIDDNPTPWLAAAGGVVVAIAGTIALLVLRRR